MEENKRAGWYYVGGGRLRFMDAEGWTDQYRDIDKRPPASPPTVSSASDGVPAVGPPVKQLNPWLIAAMSAGVTAVAVSAAWATGLLPSGTAAAKPTSITTPASALTHRPAVTRPPGGATSAFSKRERVFVLNIRKFGAFRGQPDAKIVRVGNFACQTARKLQPDGGSMIAALNHASREPNTTTTPPPTREPSKLCVRNSMASGPRR
ncbi:MAG TPA: hypothetical protein VFL67_05530 [Mycobacterium sp.]|nr:hypothetical protein [Mycobacterium sp.]